MKKVIFVLSTSYSGSTMLDMMLSNGEEGFSCGEVYALFRPWRADHFSPKCGCGESDCRVWEKIASYGEKELYSGIFSEHSDVRFAVDSSKDLAWLRDQMKNLTRQGIQPITLLIWKDPLEYALSCWKRGKAPYWEFRWANYYSTLFSISDDWISLRYSALAENPRETLEQLCSVLEIPFYDGKENFWEGTHHTLFGSKSAKAHLVDRNSPKYNEVEKNRAKAKPNVNVDQIEEIKGHRKIYYDPKYDKKMPDELREGFRLKPWISNVQEILELTNFLVPPDQGIIAKAKRTPYLPFWYPKDRVRHWLYRQRTKYQLKAGKYGLDDSETYL